MSNQGQSKGKETRKNIRPFPIEELKSVAAEKAAKDRERIRAKEKPIGRPEEFDVYREAGKKGGTKSRERVQELAEVFTAEREVKAMLDLVGDMFEFKADNLTKRFLEPACGNGNFLEEIAARKMAIVSAISKEQADFEFNILLALSSIYGVDISAENIEQAKERLYSLVLKTYSTGRRRWQKGKEFDRAVRHILDTNIILGDTLNGADEIIFTEYTSPTPLCFTQRRFRLSDMEFSAATNKAPCTLGITGTRHYLQLGE